MGFNLGSIMYAGTQVWWALQLVYSKQAIIGLTQKFCLVDAYVGGTFRQLSYRDETLAQIASHKKKKELIDKEIIIIHACVCEKFKEQKY